MVKAKIKEVKKKGKEIVKKEIEVEDGNDDLGGEITITFNDDEGEEPVEVEESVVSFKAILKGKKPIAQIKKGDRISVDGKEYIVDAHYILIDHGTTKEMAIELVDNSDKDYQLRYFNDQVDATIEFYELQEILYVRKPITKVEW